MQRKSLIAFLVGETEIFRQIAPQTWMSDQVLVRVGRGSSRSIYLPDER